MTHLCQRVAFLLLFLFCCTCGFSPILSPPRGTPRRTVVDVNAPRDASLSTPLWLFNKMFEEDGPLGKGITVGKVQVALQCRDRSRDSIVGLLEEKSKVDATSTSLQLARLGNEVCLALLRKSDDWVAACSESKWFSQNDAGKAESCFNDWANKEAAKFEKEYTPEGEAGAGGSTLAVVSLIVEIQGDETKFDGAGFSLSGTKDVLSSIAGDCLVERGSCVNAVEVFWTPGDRDEVLTKEDLYMDFPELIDL